MKTTRRDFLQTTLGGALTFGLLPDALPLAVAERSNKNALPRKSPESQGVSSNAILDFVRAANASGTEWHSFMMLRHGNVIAEGWWSPFQPEFKHSLHSLSKSFTSTAIGFLVDEGKLSVDDLVISFFPDKLPANPSENLKAMRVKHLLTMTSGHDKPDAYATTTSCWVKLFLEGPVPHPPGTHFLYDAQATYMLGAIVHKLTGQRLDEFLASRLFQPLGITNYDWETSPEGLSFASSRLRLKTEDMAKFGQLYLQKGHWQSRQILSEKWVQEATRKQTDTPADDSESSHGYGYQFWSCQPNRVYRGDGSFEQLCVIMPEQDAVVVVTGQIWARHGALKLIWEMLLPALLTPTVPGNVVEAATLKTELNRLAIPVAKGSLTSPVAARFQGRTFAFDKNSFDAREVRFLFNDKRCVVAFSTSGGSVSFEFGWNTWHLNKGMPKNLFNLPGLTPANLQFPSKIAGTATWLAPNNLQLTIKYVEDLHHDTLTCMFEGDTVRISFLNSIVENTKRATETRQPLTGILKQSTN